MPAVVAVISRASDKISGVIISPIIRSPIVSRMPVNIIPGFMSWGPVVGGSVQIALVMPV